MLHSPGVMEDRMAFLRFVFVLVMSLHVAACTVNAPQISEPASIEVPDGKNTKTIELRKLKSRVAKGTEVGKIGEGWGCLAFQKAQWQAGRANIADSDMQSVFVEELKRHNYNVLGDPDDLFDNKAGRAELAVGGLITDIKWDICFHNGYLDNWSAGSTYVEIGIEWQVYNTMDKKIIYKCFTTGQAKANFTSRQYEDGFRQAMAHAVRGLLADKGFVNVAMEKEASGPMGGLTEISPTPRSEAGGQTAAVKAGKGNTAPVKGKALTIDEVKKRVVVIQTPNSHGSGFLFGNEGIILTNDHVVRDNKRVRIIYPDGARVEGAVVNKNTQQDVAMVKVDSQPVSGLTARLDDLPGATDVFAIGAPFEMNLQGSISKGVVSGYRSDRLGRWLQSDVAINGGNSGGPLVDSQGRVVGMCSKGVGATNTGVNFFVPIADALRVMGISAN